MSAPAPVPAAQREAVLRLLGEERSYSDVARELGIPYGRVYHIANQAGLTRRRSEIREAAEQAAKQAALDKQRADRARLVELLDAYRRGELVPAEPRTPADFAVCMHDGLIVHPRVARLCAWLDGPLTYRERMAWRDGPLGYDEQRALDGLEDLVVLPALVNREPRR